MGTRRYVVGKILQSLLTVGFVIVFNFFLFRVLPGDPEALLLRGSSNVSPEARAALRADWGLDQPLPQQFATYVLDTVTLNFGVSLATGASVVPLILARLGPTLLLVGLSTIASALIGLWIGIKAGWRRGSSFDLGATGSSLVAYAMPEFWFGLMLLIAFSGGVGIFPAIFPSGGYATAGADLTGFAHIVDVLNHMVLPFITLTVAYLGEYALIMRSSLLDVVGEDYLVTAKAKGLRDKHVLWRHAVPNALLPTLTLVFLSLGFVFSGAITVEYVFSWPGLGDLTVDAIDTRDFPVLQALFLLFSVTVILANLVADFLYARLDPRVRAG